MPVLTSQSAPRRSLSRATAVSAAVVILLFFASCLHSAKRDSVSWDESQHLYSGWLSWERGDFGYNPEVPPLVKMWDAIPLLHRDIKQPAFTGDHFKKEGFVLGQRFLVANGIDQTLIPARVMASLLTVFLATLLFFCAREMFGDKAAMFALLLFCLDPNFLAHGAYVTTDIGASLTMLAAVYAFYRYMQRPTVARMIIVGLAVGLAMTAKFTGVFICSGLVPDRSHRLLAIGYQVSIASANDHCDRSYFVDRSGMHLGSIPLPLCGSTQPSPVEPDE
jgi:dolichyl-phosphate-mannose--protein O-mannosyl transferase